MRKPYSEIADLIEKALELATNEEAALLRFILDNAKAEADALGQQVLVQVNHVQDDFVRKQDHPV